MRQGRKQDDLRFQNELRETVAAMGSRKPFPEEKPATFREILRQAFRPIEHLVKSKAFLICLTLGLLLVYFAPRIANLLR